MKLLKTTRKGFTVIELLIVIVSIAILATVTVIAYNGISTKAAMADLASEGHSISQQIELDYSKRGKFAPDVASLNDNKGLRQGENTKVEYTSTNKSFCLTVSSEKARGSYFYNQSGAQGEGTCPGHEGYTGGGVGGSGFWSAVSSSGGTTCGLASGSVYCWGDEVAVPTKVNGLLAGKTVTKVSVGEINTCAIADGSAYCWGSNYYGQLGNGTTNDSSAPVAVSKTGVLAGKTVVDIDTFNGHTCASTADSKVFCWGYNSNAQLGNQNTANSSLPVSLMTNNGSGWTSPAHGKPVSGLATGGNYTCVIADSQPYCWGGNERAQLGFNGTSSSHAIGRVTSTGVLAGLTASKISTGTNNTCVVASDSRAYCWQTTGYGPTLNGTGVSSELPVAVSTTNGLAGKDVVDISSGSNFNCLVTSEGKVYCWGSNNGGQLGNNSTVNSTTPVKVVDTGVLSGKKVTSVAVGDSHACALASGEIYCWGANFNNQLGNGNTNDSLVPVLVSRP